MKGSAVERTLIIFKPDALRRDLEPVLSARWLQKGYQLVAYGQLTATKAQMEQHYAQHAGYFYFDALVQRMIAGPCAIMVVQGPNVIRWSRAIQGATDPAKAEPWTIRGMYATTMEENLVHASDSPEAAEREIALWMPLVCK